MKSTFSFIKDSALLKMTIAVVAGVLLVVGTATASTTISTNISTGGTLAVTGASTLTGLTSMVQASSTRFSVHDTAYFGGTATTTINSAGNVSVAGTLSVTGASTLTGLTSVVQASSTRFSVHDTAYFGGTATSTFGSDGSLTIGAVSSLTVTGSTTVASTTATSFKVGQVGTQMSGIVSGVCTFGTVNITASTTGMVSCSSATGVQSGDRVFVQATSSLPDVFIIQAASSTATGVIQVDIANLGHTTTVATGVNSIYFWAVR